LRDIVDGRVHIAERTCVHETRIRLEGSKLRAEGGPKNPRPKDEEPCQGNRQRQTGCRENNGTWLLHPTFQGAPSQGSEGEESGGKSEYRVLSTEYSVPTTEGCELRTPY